MSGSVTIKNISGSNYAVAELGGLIIADDATIDLMDDSLAAFYNNYDMVEALVTTPNNSQLWTDIQAGNIKVIATVPPHPGLRSPE
jgi:hypothetical protein